MIFFAVYSRTITVTIQILITKKTIIIMESNSRVVKDIDEKALLNSIYERDWGNSLPDKLTTQSKQNTANEESVQVASVEATATSEQSTQSESKRIGSKQRKTSLEEFKKQFMISPKIDDRKPVFVSLVTRDSLDRVARLFGERGLSVSGLVENLARNFLETYKDDVEQWRKMYTEYNQYNV